MSRYGGLGFLNSGVLGGFGLDIVFAATGHPTNQNPAYEADDFYKLFPQFQGRIEPAVISQYIKMADGTVSSMKWGSAWALGMGLYVAHLATLDLRVRSDINSSDASVAASSGPFGVASSKSVGDLSVSYDYSLGATDGGGLLKTTQYGQRYWDMARLLRGPGLTGW